MVQQLTALLSTATAEKNSNLPSKTSAGPVLGQQIEEALKKAAAAAMESTLIVDDSQIACMSPDEKGVMKVDEDKMRKLLIDRFADLFSQTAGNAIASAIETYIKQTIETSISTSLVCPVGGIPVTTPHGPGAISGPTTLTGAKITII